MPARFKFTAVILLLLLRYICWWCVYAIGDTSRETIYWYCYCISGYTWALMNEGISLACISIVLLNSLASLASLRILCMICSYFSFYRAFSYCMHIISLACISFNSLISSCNCSTTLRLSSTIAVATGLTWTLLPSICLISSLASWSWGLLRATRRTKGSIREIRRITPVDSLRVWSILFLNFSSVSFRS